MTTKKKPTEKPEKRIAILGTTPSRMQGPVQDDSGWERWTIGPGGKDAHGWEKLFEIHRTWPLDFKDYLNDLSNVEPPREVVTFEPMPRLMEKWRIHHKMDEKTFKETITGDWKANKVYPRKEIIQKYGTPWSFWFSSSISWLIPLAMEENPVQIGLWGIDLEAGEEYRSQWVGCIHFLDLATKAGVDVVLPDDCGLLRDPRPYPDRYETFYALTMEKKKKWLNAHLDNMQTTFDRLRNEVHRQEGRVLMQRHYVDEGKGSAEDLQQMEQQLDHTQTQLSKVSQNINQLRGELSATDFYQRMFVWGYQDPEEMNPYDDA